MTATEARVRGEPRTSLSPGAYAALVFAVALTAALLVVGVVAGDALPVALLAGVALASAALLSRRNAVWLLAFLVITYGGTLLEQGYGVPSPVLPLALLVVLASGPVRIVTHEERGPALDAILLAGAYGAVLLASSLVAGDFATATDAVMRQGRAAFVMVAVAAYVAAARSLRPVVWGLVVGGLVVAVIVDFQTITRTFDNDYWGLAKAPVRQIAGADSRPRAAGPIGDPNFFAQSMVVVVALAVERLKNSRMPAHRAIAGLAALAASASVVFSFSRGGFAALAVVLAISLLARPRSRTLLVATGVVLLLASPFVVRELGPRFAGMRGVTDVSAGRVATDRAVSGRAAEMLAAVQMFGDHPWLGVGVGNFNERYQDYAARGDLEQRRGGRSAHSLPLEIAAEIGLVGLVAFSAMVAVAYRRLRSTAVAPRDGPAADERLMAQGVAVALTGFLTASLLLHGAYPELMWVLLGLGIASSSLLGAEQTERSRLPAS